MRDLPIYLDYMATTPLDPRILPDMLSCLTAEGDFGNPSSVHPYGKAAMLRVESARADIAACLSTSPDSLIFTSGATESNQLAIIGAAEFYQRKGRHVITMSTEHPSVLDCFKRLEKSGFSVTYLQPTQEGLLDLDVLNAALTSETILVSIMHVNNELGVIQDIAAIGNLLRDKGIVFHVDAAQSVGKCAIDLSTLNVDLMSLSAHKQYGPKGVGALYIRQKPRIRLLPQTGGGGHERGLRSGTLPTHQIVGMGAAYKLALEERIPEQKRVAKLRDTLWEGIADIPGIQRNGAPHACVAGHLNVSFAGIDPADLLPALQPLAVSTSSACSALSLEPSHVLKAIGLSDILAYSTIRLSIGRFTSEEDVTLAIDSIRSGIAHLRR